MIGNNSIYFYPRLNLEDKVIYLHTILKERKKGYSFGRMGRERNVTEKNMRNEYKKALRLKTWEKSDLWKLLYEFTKDYPSSYAVRLYGFLLTKNISSIKKFKETDLTDIFAIKGVGVKYQNTIVQMKNYLNNTFSE